MTAESFAAKGLPRFRMLSVDGAHMVEAALVGLVHLRVLSIYTSDSASWHR
jgi:hypothetical protein